MTYAYCVIASPRKPSVARVPRGLPGASGVRLLEIDSGLYLAAADVPAREYDADAINRRLSDLDWVSRAAVAHERVVEAFPAAVAVLPMKLFTIFTTDERALDHVRAARPRLAAMVKRVGNHDEFGVRVILDRAKAAAARRKPAARKAAAASGIAYLTRKKAHRDAAIELAEHARETVAGLYDRLAARSRQARRRPASELPAENGPLLLDAAFLVARGRARAFRAEVARQARALSKHGYGLTLSGPWPPYTFVKD